MQALLLMLWNGGTLCRADLPGGVHRHDQVAVHAEVAASQSAPPRQLHPTASRHAASHAGDAHRHAAHQAEAGPQQGAQQQVGYASPTGASPGSPHFDHSSTACSGTGVCATPAVAASGNAAPRLALVHREVRAADAPLELHSSINPLDPPPPRS